MRKSDAGTMIMVLAVYGTFIILKKILMLKQEITATRPMPMKIT